MKRRDMVIGGLSAAFLLPALTSPAWASAGSESPLSYGAVADGITNDSAAFAAAQAAAITSGSKLLIVPGGSYFIGTTINIADGVTWIFQGARLSTNINDRLLSASGVSNWSILGRLFLTGTRSTMGVAVSAQHGLTIENCNDYLVENVSARNMGGNGFYVTGALATGRAGRQFSNCSAKNCQYGRRIDTGAGGEYTTWTNWTAESGYIGDSIAGGNTMTTGGSITNNLGGVELSGGPNHGHGFYSGVSINHNSVYNIEAIGVTNGFTFSGCHFYENQVILRASKGIFIRDGIFDCRVYNDGATGSGENGVTDCFMPGDYFPTPTWGVTGADNGTGYSQFSFQRCSGPGAS